MSSPIANDFDVVPSRPTSKRMRKKTCCGSCQPYYNTTPNGAQVSSRHPDLQRPTTPEWYFDLNFPDELTPVAAPSEPRKRKKKNKGNKYDIQVPKKSKAIPSKGRGGWSTSVQIPDPLFDSDKPLPVSKPVETSNYKPYNISLNPFMPHSEVEDNPHGLKCYENLPPFDEIELEEALNERRKSYPIEDEERLEEDVVCDPVNRIKESSQTVATIDESVGYEPYFGLAEMEQPPYEEHLSDSLWDVPSDQTHEQSLLDDILDQPIGQAHQDSPTDIFDRSAYESIFDQPLEQIYEGSMLDIYDVPLDSIIYAEL